MTMHPNLNNHDAAWAPNGRTSDVPIMDNGPNPLKEEPAAENAKAPAIYEIVRLTKDGGPLTKQISLNNDGSTTSDGSACTMPRGTAERVLLAGVTDLAALILHMRSDQAIALGALRADLPDQVSVVTKDKLKELNGYAGTNAIARTAGSINYRANQPGFALLDYDSKGIPLEVEAKLQSHGTYWYWTALCDVLPELKGAAYVKRRSTSAGLLRTDTGEKLPGSKGIHIYIAVKDSGDSERFLKTLHERCWLAGYGWMMVGAGGQLLERSIVDRMVGAPERLVFEGKPVLVPPLDQDQDARRPVAVDGEMLDTVIVCPPLSILEQSLLLDMRAKARYALAGESAKARTAFIEEQTEQNVKRTGMSRASAMEIAAKQCNGILLPIVELPFDDPELAGNTVADVLNDPVRFEGETLADPLEGIAYGKCKAKVMLRPDGTPWINSFAHGRTIYELKLDAEAVRAAMDAASEDEVLSTFVRLVLQASIDAAALEDLTAHVKERTGRGTRAITRTLEQAQSEQAKKQAESEHNRRAAERNDPRPQLPAPGPDTPWLPQMKAYNEVLSIARDAVPPSRDIGGDATRVQMIEITGTYAFTAAKAA
jgi:hypothetical protein